MVDLPNLSVLISGLEFWLPGGEPSSEPRLNGKLAEVLGIPSVDLRTPPSADKDPAAPMTGIPPFQFPEWFMTQHVERDQKNEMQSRLLVHRKTLTRGKYIDRDRNRRSVVPIRFVRA